MDEKKRKYLIRLLMDNANREQKLKAEGRFDTEYGRTLIDPSTVMSFFGNEVTAQEAFELAELYNETVNNERAKKTLDSFVLDDRVTQEEMEGQLTALLQEVSMNIETDIVK